MVVVGIDPSLTGTGIVGWWDGNIVLAKTLPNQPELDIYKRVAEICNQIIFHIGNLLPDSEEWLCDPDVVVIEGFAYGAKGRGLFEIAYLGHRIREEFWREGYKWIEYSPNELKKFVTGKGNSPKDVMMQQVLKKWGYEAKDNNQCDAYALAMMGVKSLIEGGE